MIERFRFDYFPFLMEEESPVSIRKRPLAKESRDDAMLRVTRKNTPPKFVVAIVPKQNPDASDE